MSAPTFTSAPANSSQVMGLASQEGHKIDDGLLPQSQSDTVKVSPRRAECKLASKYLELRLVQKIVR